MGRAYRATLDALLRDGVEVPIGQSLSTAAGRTTVELLNYSFAVPSLNDRLVASDERPFNVFAAVGRLAWLLSGSSLVRDIEFYDPRARAFSDDGISIPGSCDGARLLVARPGQNQLVRVVDLLRREENTRRAAVAIYMPEDVGRTSVDIPCTISLVFNVRADQLHAATLMRANNALSVLPYDVFQFSMVAELVAAQLGVQNGTYFHFAASMHLYSNEIDVAQRVAGEHILAEGAEMPVMPRGDAFGDAMRFVDTEAMIRNLAVTGKPELLQSDETLASVEALGEYWGSHARVVLIWAVCQARSQEDRQWVRAQCDRLPPSLADMVRRRLARRA